MKLSELATSLKNSLQSSARLIEGSNTSYDWTPFVQLAVKHFSQYKPRTLVGSVTLVPGQTIYDFPADFVDFKFSLWGSEALAKLKPWECGYPSKMPRATTLQGTPAQLSLSFPPSEEMINSLGHTYSFYYYAEHKVDEESSTIPDQYEKDLLLAAQAEVMKQISFDKVGKVTAKDPFSGLARTAHPSALYELLMKQFKENLCG